MDGKSVATVEWFCCPICGQKLARVTPLAKGGVFLKCKRCRNEVEVVYEKAKSTA